MSETKWKCIDSAFGISYCRKFWIFSDNQWVKFWKSTESILLKIINVWSLLFLFFNNLVLFIYQLYIGRKCSVCVCNFGLLIFFTFRIFFVCHRVWSNPQPLSVDLLFLLFESYFSYCVHEFSFVNFPIPVNYYMNDFRQIILLFFMKHHLICLSVKR